MEIILWRYFLITVAFVSPAHADLIWPTPNPAFRDGQPIEAYVQATSSGNPESGLFGCVRNQGSRFHEGLDLYPVKRDSNGEAADPIYAALSGKVVYVNRVPGFSSYGRYIIVEHDGEIPAYHTLYAHLASVDIGVVAGTHVDAGTVLGIMGRSASYNIPSARAHLHFEIGFRLSDGFQNWYDSQKFKNKNHHGKWNGINLVSIDPLDFYKSIRRGQVRNLYDFLCSTPVAARIRVYSQEIPDFVRNYDALLTKPLNMRPVVAWDIAFTEYGVPKEWTPRFTGENLSGKEGQVKILTYNPELLKSQSCQRVLAFSGGQPSLTVGTLNTIKKLFGYR